MNIKEFEITCKHCGHQFTPRTDSPKKCPKCNRKLPKVKLKFNTKQQLKEFTALHYAAGFLTLLVGSVMTLMFLNVVGIIFGAIGMLFFMVLGERYFVEYRIYDLLHKSKGE